MKYTLKNKENLIRIRIQISENFYIGPGKVLLMESILNKGSISSAARDIGMSYKKAWNLIKEINKFSKNKIVITNTGGQGVRGAKISEEGVSFIKSFRNIEKKVFKESKVEKKNLLKIFNNK